MYAGSGCLEFHPAVPECFGGDITLRGLRYGKATIELNLRGSGSRIASFEIDGKATADYRLPSGMSGPHRVDISLANNSMDDGTFAEGQLQWCPPTPEVTWHTPVSGRIADYSGSFQYSLVIDGLADMRLASAGVSLPAMNGVASVGVVAQGSDGQPGFCSAPRIYSPRGAVSRVEAEDYNRGGTRLVRDRRASHRYVESGAEGIKCISLTLTEPEEVDCLIDVCYANGNGPAGDPSSTALRRIIVNGEDAGIIVMPPRGNGWWLSTGYSSRVRARLRRGVNDIAVSVVDNLGENASTDMVLVDNVRIVRLADND